MIKSRKLQLVVMVLISVCTCGLILGSEPNETKVGLKFEIGTDEKPWFISSRTDEIGRGPINPTHLAHFYINERQKCPTLPGSSWIKSILESSAGQSMSRKQKSFVKTGREDFLRLGIFSELGPMKKGFYYFRLFATSEDDAKKMAQATIEVLTNKANAKLQKLRTERQELQEKIADIKKELPEKQKQFEAAESKYKEIKNARYSSLNDFDTYKKAMETMLQMDNMLDVLEIELAGIQEKLKSIEKYQRRKDERDLKHFSRETLDKLDQMHVEQIVELRGVEARKKAALQIQRRKKEFLDLFNQWSNLDSEVKRLKDNLNDSENNMRDVEKTLTNPPSDMLPPKVFQNKVTIYPVRVEED